jgi:hypothetical protein
MTLTAPAEILGTEKKNGGFTKTNPKSWSQKEIDWCLEKKQEGFSTADIASALQRSEVSVQIKLKRLTKSDDSYNKRFRDAKYYVNELFLEHIQPKKVLDVFAGDSWWASKVDTCWTNDIDEKFNTDYHYDALELMTRMFLENESFDLIDLDPFGSAYECFDFAIRMAKKGLVVSFGEWGHKRWKRTDFVEPRYGIETLDQWSEDLFIKEIQRIARLHKKQATVYNKMQYGNFLRVYFVLETVKQTSQWEK